MSDDILDSYMRTNRCDLLVFVGSLELSADNSLISECSNDAPPADNVHFMVITPGGLASVSYRMARFLQQRYQELTLLVPSYCTSAGTILAIGAHKILMSATAQLGPIDVQIGKKDELGERQSGLTLLTSLDALQDNAFKAFERSFLNVRFRSELQISTRSCMEIAERLAVGLYTPIFGQIDPMRLGEDSRSLLVAQAYAERLRKQTNSIGDEALSKLLFGYPSHDFVIDRGEAKTLFNSIVDFSREVDSVVEKLLEHIDSSQSDIDKPIIKLYNSSINDKTKPNNGSNHEASRQGSQQNKGRKLPKVDLSVESAKGGKKDNSSEGTQAIRQDFQRVKVI